MIYSLPPYAMKAFDVDFEIKSIIFTFRMDDFKWWVRSSYNPKP